jgi:hypothetical protein
MMKLRSRLPSRPSYSSLLRHESKAIPGVNYAIRRVSLSQRIELTKKVRELSIRYEFLRAGNTADQLEASLADLLVRRLYLEWGLAELSGLRVDEQPATVEVLIDRGPEALSDEIIAVIRAELGLSEEERKNS